MKKNLQLFSKQALLLCLILISSMSWGQTATYDFSASGAVTGLDANPPISVDANIGFASFKNSAGTNPAIFSGKLRLYQNTTKGGSIKIYAQNGATISSVVVYASEITGPAKYSVDGASASSIAYSSGSYSIIAINATNEVEFFCVGSNSGTRVYVDKFEVTYTITPTAAPEVTAATVTGSYNTAVNYQVVASNSPTSYAIESGTLPNGLSMNGTTTGVIAGTPTEVGSFSINVTATNDVGTSAATTINFEIAKANQTITFEEVTDQQYGAANFNLTATSSSGLPLTYTSSNTAVATVSGATVTVIGMGTTNITASQEGNTYYFAAADALQSLTVTAKELTVTGLTANDKLQDGTTAATLSGTASLNGIVAGDETDVVLSGTPTATFASALPGTGIAVSVTGYAITGTKASNYSLTQPELTATITALEIPVATPATTITTDSFTANWNAVPGATGYELDVSDSENFGTLTTSQVTEGFETGLTGSYQTGIVVLSSGSWIVTDVLNGSSGTNSGSFSAQLKSTTNAALVSPSFANGISSITFWVTASTTSGSIQVNYSIDGGVTWLPSTGSPFTSLTTTKTQKTITLNTIVPTIFQIKRTAATIYIDDIEINSNVITPSFLAGYESKQISGGSTVTEIVSGLNSETEYFYRVRAVNGTASLNSNEIEVTTAAPAAITWNGTSWSNTTGPDATLDAVIDGNYNETANITAKNLTVAAGVVVTVAPTSVLTVSGDLVNNGTLVFESTAAGTASFAPYNGAPISGTGTATVERYIPAKRAWRFLTAPLQGTTNNELVANWQGTADEGMLLFAPATYQSQTMTGYAVGGTAPNIFKYNAGWQAIPDLTSENLFGATANDTQAYQIFVTGASNSTNIATGAAATTLRPKGTLITGTVNHVLTANAYKLLPNPYASPIDTEAMVVNNAGSKVWLLDPTIGFGAYVTYDGANWSASTTGNDKYIQSGQGFFVKSTNTSFAIQEALKVTGNSNTWFDRNATASNDTKIRVLLYKQDAADWQLADAILAVNSMNGNTAVDAADASKISNYNESLMFRNGTSNLAIEYRGVPQVNEIQPLRLTGTSATGYQLRIYVESFIENSLVPLLEDTLLGTFTAIPTDGSTVTIPFTGVVSNTTNPDDRFRMVYQTALSNDSFESLNVVVYPNPVSNGTLSVNLPQGEDAAFELYNVLGQKVQQGILAATNNSVNVSRLQSGVYVLNIEQSGKKFTTKVIVDAN